MSNFSPKGNSMSKQVAVEFSVESALDELERIYQANVGRPGNIIPILQQLQESFGYVPEVAVSWFAEKLDVPESTFFGVATFYAQFSFEPKGKNVVTVCCGTACHVKGAEKIMSGLRRELNLAEGEHTTSDKMFTLEKANCVGACSIAPVVIMNKEVLGKTSADKVLKLVKSMAGEVSTEND